VSALDQRYGRAPATRRRSVIALASTLGLLGIAFAGWFGWASGRQDVQWQDAGFQITGDDGADVAFVVTLAPGVRAFCTVHATNQRLDEVGRLDVAVGPGDGRPTRISVHLATAERAMIAAVKACARA
jgi:hypothetical protein